MALLQAGPAPAPEGAARAGPVILTEHGVAPSLGLDRLYYVPGFFLGWVFAPRRHLQVSAGAGLEYFWESARLGTSIADCSAPCPVWTRNHLRVQGDLRLGPAWEAAWPWLRLRAGYSHQWVDTGQVPDDPLSPPPRDDFTVSGGTVNLGTGVSFYAFGGLTLGLEAGGGLLLYGAGNVLGVGQLGIHAGWSFGRRGQ